MSDTSDHIHARACSARRCASAPDSRAAATAPAIASHTSGMPVPVTADAVSTDDRPAAGVADVERARVVGGRATGGRFELAVGLVDDEEVGELDDAALHALQLVAAARREQQHEHVDHARDRDLRLADADRLDDHDVARRGLAHEHRLARAARDTAERAARRRRADERVRLARELAPCASCRRGSSRRVRVLDGSTASTAILSPASTRACPSASMNVDFPAPGAPVIPTRTARAGRRHQRVEQRVRFVAMVGAASTRRA